jgi:selT/selW/selH-like putative selenoprotein
MLQNEYGAEVELVPGVGGVFEITVDGQLKFSKKKMGRFPTDDEVLAVGKA